MIDAFTTFVETHNIGVLHVVQFISISSVLALGAVTAYTSSLKRGTIFDWLKVYALLLVILVAHIAKFWKLFSVSSNDMDSLASTVLVASSLFVLISSVHSFLSNLRTSLRKHRNNRKREEYY